jgi:hypothetical protein
LVVRCDMFRHLSLRCRHLRLASRYRTTDKTKLQLLQAFAHESG